MIYPSKEECYEDILISLWTGVLREEDLRSLLEYYKEMEFYECCSGLAEAYVKYKEEYNEYFNYQKTRLSKGDS
jgi:hypothetical protein